MKNNAYWQERFTMLEETLNSYGNDTYNQILPAFDKAQREIQKEIDSWTIRIAKNNNVTLSEARRLLDKSELAEFKWDVNEFIKYGKKNKLNPIWVKQLENASAKYHISRLEALQIRLQQEIEKAFGNELDSIDEMARKVYSQGYYHSCFEIQKGLQIGHDIGQIDSGKLDKLISKPWAADGKNFSSRVWQSKTTMVGDLHNELVRTCVLGEAPDKTIAHMTKYVDGKFKNAKYQAGRLVMTEQAFFYSASQKDAFNDLGVEQFEIVATLDSHTSEICQQMDGKHFFMKDFEPGVTAPPFHVWCRSCTCPYFDDEFTGGERAFRDKEGKTYYVDSDITYKKWYNKYVESNELTCLKKDIKNRGIRGRVIVPPEQIDIDKLTFDDLHINKQRGHKVDEHTAKEFIKNSQISISRWDGKFMNYYGNKGSAYVNTKTKEIRTAFCADEYDENTRFILEVLKKYGFRK